jgi:hypothetical protein
MNIRPLGSLFVMVLAAVTLHAQTADATGGNPVLPPPPPGASTYPNAGAPAYPPAPAYPAAPAASAPPYASAPMYGYGGYESFRAGPTLAGAITVPYAFNWHAAGVSAELGGMVFGQNFVGGEIGYYGGDAQRYAVYHGPTYLGSFRSDQNVTTLDFAYRLYLPLDPRNSAVPVSFYLGGDVGAAFVSYSSYPYGYGFYNDNDAAFNVDGLAGFQVRIAPGAALRLGYRYIYVNDAWRFNQQVNLGSSALEASLAFRF